MSNRLKKGDSVPYAQIANEILYSKDLSLKAKGLYSFMYAKPNDWNFTASSMAKQLKEGRRAILSILQELKELGLIEYEKLSNGKGVYTIFSTLKPKKQPKCENSTLPKNSQSAKTAPCGNSTVQKPHCIINKDSITNKDSNKNPEKGLDDKSSSKEHKKQKLNLPFEVSQFRKKLLSHEYTGFLEKVFVEDKEENVYIDSSRKIYTDSRSNKQILTSTLEEIYKQLHNINEMNKRANTQKLSSTLANLKG